MRDNDSQKIIVVGIPKTMDDAALSELFSGFGTVAEAKVVLDANNKQPRGFGFVTFTSGAAMRKAIQDMNKKVVEGRTLNVRQLIPKDKFQADKSKDENAPDAASRPCWLLRKGKCTKGDQCPFSHETKNGEFGSCFEFMQTGECKRGDKCIFSHKVAGANKDGEEQEEETVAETAKAKPESKKPLVAGAAKKEDGGEQKQRVCYAFQKGKCHRGKKCLYLHEKVPEMANDVPVPVVVTKKDGAAPATKRGDFEVVTQTDAGKKRSRAEDSHDDDSGDDDNEEEVKPAAKQQKSAPSSVKTAVPPKSDGALQRLATHMSATVNKAKPAPTQASPAKQVPRSEDNSKPSSEKRPRSDDATKPFEKRPRVEHANSSNSGYKNKFEQREQRLEQMREHPAAKRIMEREQLKNGPSKYGGYTTPQAPPQPKRKEDVWKARNNKNALQRLNKKNRVPGQQPEQQHQQCEDGERPPPKQKREKVDMGAAFDSDDDRKPRSGNSGSGGKKKVVDKVAQKANREKLQMERRAKRDAKKSALSRLQTQEKVEL